MDVFNGQMAELRALTGAARTFLPLVPTAYPLLPQSLLPLFAILPLTPPLEAKNPAGP